MVSNRDCMEKYFDPVVLHRYTCPTTTRTSRLHWDISYSYFKHWRVCNFNWRLRMSGVFWGCISIVIPGRVFPRTLTRRPARRDGLAIRIANSKRTRPAWRHANVPVNLWIIRDCNFIIGLLMTPHNVMMLHLQNATRTLLHGSRYDIEYACELTLLLRCLFTKH